MYSKKINRNKQHDDLHPKKRFLFHKEYSFHPKLDNVFLQAFYEGDIEQANFSFNLFISVTVHELFNLKKQLFSKDWKDIQCSLHKIKPNFKMVGLCNHHKIIEEIECSENKKVDNIKRLHYLCEELEEVYIPIIKNEIRNMTSILRNETYLPQ